MIKKILTTTIFILFVLINTTAVLAIPKNERCDPTDDLDNHGCQSGLFCKHEDGLQPDLGLCKEQIPLNTRCDPTDDLDNHGCQSGLFCKHEDGLQPDLGLCKKDSRIKAIFGTVKPPLPLAGFLQKDPTGASAISDFLSRFITLLFSIAAIVLIFMIIWGAFEWLTSGGDKEKLSAAQKRIINAIIGIILFAAAFAIIQVLGTFTGFTFFTG